MNGLPFSSTTLTATEPTSDLTVHIISWCPSFTFNGGIEYEPSGLWTGITGVPPTVTVVTVVPVGGVIVVLPAGGTSPPTTLPPFLVTSCLVTYTCPFVPTTVTVTTPFLGAGGVFFSIV